MSEKRRRPVRPSAGQASPQKTARARDAASGKQPSGNKAAFVRFCVSGGLIAGVVLASFSLSSVLPAPDDPLSASAEASITPEPSPSAEPPISPTPAAFAPFGAQYGYGGEELIPQTPTPVPTDTPLVFTPTPTDTPAPSGYATLRKGASSEDVRKMQQALFDLGYLTDTVDGNYGANTANAVTAFQAINGLEADGVAGNKTLTLLYSGDAKPASAAPATDFLILVNRTHTLDENYVPSDLVSIANLLPSDIVKVKYKGTQANRTATEALAVMLRAAAADGITNWQVSSAYRTWKEQQKLVDNSVSAYLKNHSDWTKKQALSATYNTVAPAGTSEHQTGLSFDVTVPGVSFTGTKQQKWLHAHCAEYGFVVRFTEKKQKLTGFIAESWHIRYVGLEAAQIMTANDWCLEEYIDVLGK